MVALYTHPRQIRLAPSPLPSGLGSHDASAAPDFPQWGDIKDRLPRRPSPHGYRIHPIVAGRYEVAPRGGEGQESGEGRVLRNGRTGETGEGCKEGEGVRGGWRGGGLEGGWNTY